MVLAPSAARASSTLVFTSADFTTLGLRPASVTVGSARGELGAGLSSGVRALLAGAPAWASAASANGQQWRSDAFVLRSSAVAEQVLTSWRSVHRAQRVAVGAGGAVFVQRSRGRALAQVLWRDGARLGLIVLTATRNVSQARETALAFTALADAYLKTALPTTAWAKVLDEVRPDGTVSEQTALQAFALAYGPVPGVHAPHGPIGQIPDGTMAAQWVLGYRSRLSAPQLRVVDRLLGLAAPGRSARVAGPPDHGDPGWVENPHLDNLARGWVEDYDAKFGITLPLTVLAGYTTTVIPNPNVGGEAPADATPLDNAAGGYGSGDPRICRVRLTALGKSYSADNQSSVVAHEVFHCFEFYFLGAKSWYDDPKAWILEGLAVWGQLSVDAIAPNGFAYEMSNYLKSPDTQLFTRNYDAVGFWGHVQDTVGNLWARIPSILNGGGNEASFDNAAADTPAFLTSWGSSLFNSRLPGQLPWSMVSPITPTGEPPTEELYPAPSSEVEAPPYTTAQYHIHSTEPLLHVAIIGSARISTVHNYTNLVDAWFCTTEAPCECPSGTSGTVPPTRPLLLPNRLGLSGDPDLGAQGEVTAVPLSFFCKQSSPSSPSGSTPPATGLLPAEPCLGLFTPSDFPGATTSQTSTVGVLSTCVYGELGSPPIVGIVSLATLPTVADAETFFNTQVTNCAARCAPLPQGIGDEAAGGSVIETPNSGGTTYPGFLGFERVDNDILTVATYPGTAASVEDLLSQGDVALLSGTSMARRPVIGDLLARGSQVVTSGVDGQRF